MKASELRIGLWVYLFGNAVALTQDHIIYLLSKGSLPEPITLTEEWLLKFGFIRGGFSKKGSDSFYEIAVGGSGLFINPDNGVVWIERGTNIFNNPALIEYVHELQNLYFALTGEELTIKEI